jgi:hypothetical protein
MGHFDQPLTAFGSINNGAKMNIGPGQRQSYLGAIRARGGKVVLMLDGNNRHYKDEHGRFDLNKWKARVNRFRGINISSYLASGTVIGHYLLDEPNDPSDWNGKAVSARTVDDMVHYSKSIWSNMATVVRTEPGSSRRTVRATSMPPGPSTSPAKALRQTTSGATSPMLKRPVSLW